MTINTQASDADLIARSLAEPELFTGVFDRHSAEILRYVYARLGPELAEDVTAETFLAAFGCRGRYDGAWSDARPWLYGIAVRRSAGIGGSRRGGCACCCQRWPTGRPRITATGWRKG